MGIYTWILLPCEIFFLRKCCRQRRRRPLICTAGLSARGEGPFRRLSCVCIWAWTAAEGGGCEPRTALERVGERWRVEGDRCFCAHAGSAAWVGSCAAGPGSGGEAGVWEGAAALHSAGGAPPAPNILIVIFFPLGASRGEFLDFGGQRPLF